MAEIYLAATDGTDGLVYIAADDGGTFNAKQVYVPRSTLTIAGSPVGPANPIPTAPISLIPTVGNAFVVTTAGTPVVAILANTIKVTARIVNPITGNGSLFVDPVNVPDVVAPGVNGTTEEIQPGQAWEAPGPLTTPVRVNSPTDGHAFTNLVY